MINRVLIRVKVVQALYSYMLTRPDRTYEQAKNELQASFEKSYELYMYLLKLIIELTNDFVCGRNRYTHEFRNGIHVHKIAV